MTNIPPKNQEELERDHPQEDILGDDALLDIEMEADVEEEEPKGRLKLTYYHVEIF